MDIKKLTEAISKTLNEKIKPIKAIEPTEEEQAFLDDMAKKIENEEGISYAELSNLQSLQSQIVWLGDVKLAEWSGIPEEVWNISCIDESLNAKKVMKEEMEYNRKIWDIFEENVAEYLNEHGVKPEGNNVMNYISKNAVEIVKAVLEKEYNYEEDDQAIFELYYNCPIHFTDKAQAIAKLLEEYLAEALKRCLTIEDKLLQISSLDKNESVTDKKNMKEAKTSNWKVIYHLEGDIELDIQAEDEDDSLKKAYDKLSKFSFRELDSVYDLNYKCIKNQKV